MAEFTFPGAGDEEFNVHFEPEELEDEEGEGETSTLDFVDGYRSGFVLGYEQGFMTGREQGYQDCLLRIHSLYADVYTDERLSQIINSMLGA